MSPLSGQASIGRGWRAYKRKESLTDTQPQIQGRVRIAGRLGMRFHGGSRPGQGVLDFSVNTNPLGVPQQLVDALEACYDVGVFSGYPDYEYAELREAISSFYSVDSESVLPTNGASEGLNLAIASMRPRSLVVVAPSYGDYDLLCKGLGAACVYALMRDLGDSFSLDPEDLLHTVERLEPPVVVVITNPNNPTGVLIEEESLRGLVESLCGRTGIVVDEAYAELSGYRGLLGSRICDSLAVVRSFTKVFSIPGLRAGFVYSASGDLIGYVDALRPAWNVNSIVECALKRILKEQGEALRRFIERSRAFVEAERMYLAESLASEGYLVYRSRTNFLLLKHPWTGAVELGEFLLRRHRILVRPAHTFRGLTKHHTRVSVRTRGDNEFLVRALAQARREL